MAVVDLFRLPFPLLQRQSSPGPQGRCARPRRVGWRRRPSHVGGLPPFPVLNSLALGYIRERQRALLKGGAPGRPGPLPPVLGSQPRACASPPAPGLTGRPRPSPPSLPPEAERRARAISSLHPHCLSTVLGTGQVLSVDKRRTERKGSPIFHSHCESGRQEPQLEPSRPPARGWLHRLLAA